LGARFNYDLPEVVETKERQMRKLRVLALWVLVASAPAYAQVTSIEASNPAPKGRDPNRVICDVEQTTGTRLGATKVCKTALEWQQLRSEHRDSLEQFQRQGTSQGCQEGQGCM
jgi:hypothetical protein